MMAFSPAGFSRYALYRCSPPRSPTADRYLPITCSKNLVECCRCRNAIETQFASPHSSLGQSLLPFLGRHSLGWGRGGRKREKSSSVSVTHAAPNPEPPFLPFFSPLQPRLEFASFFTPHPSPPPRNGRGREPRGLGERERRGRLR